MNALRLVFGWIFLACLTAAGTFYGMDEVDQRIGLARFHLHENLGITRYATVVRKVRPEPAPGPVTPAPVSPEPAAPGGPGAVITPPGTPPGTPLVPPSTPAEPAPSGPAVAPSRPADYGRPAVPDRRYPAPTAPGYPAAPAPAPRSPEYPAAPPRVPRAVPDSTPATRPKDFNEVNDHLIDVKNRAEAVYNSWASIENSLRSMNQPLRPEIKAALSSLRRYTQRAEQALRAGDAATARHDLDQAEKQMDQLQQYR